MSDSFFAPPITLRYADGRPDFTGATGDGMRADGLLLFLPGEEEIVLPFLALRSLKATGERSLFSVKNETLTATYDPDQASGVRELFVRPSKVMNKGQLPQAFLHLGGAWIIDNADASEETRSLWQSIANDPSPTSSEETGKGFTLVWNLDPAEAEVE